MKSFLKVLLVLLTAQLPGVNQDHVVVGGHEPIHAKVGDDVILPCHLEPPFDVNNLTIEWSFQGKIIHLHLSRATNDGTPDPKYKGRTFMFHDEFKDGNISLKLTNVTKEDEGNYTCYVPKLESQVKKGKVTLKLDENGDQDNLPAPGGPDPGVIGGVVGGVVGGVGALIILALITYCVVRCCRGKPIFPCRNNNFPQRRNDGDGRGNGNPGDGAEGIPLQNLGEPN